MNWFTKKIRLFKKSVSRAAYLYRYLHDLAVYLYSSREAGGKLPDPLFLLKIEENLAAAGKQESATRAEINWMKSRLHGLEGEFCALATEESTNMDIRATIYRSVEYCFVSAVAGSFAEFGTFKASTASHLARAFKAYHPRYAYMDFMHRLPNRMVYFFDSFQGLPPIQQQADSESPHVMAKVWGPGACTGLSADELSKIIAAHLPLDQFEIVTGYFKESLQDFDPSVRFAFLHVDCDLCESTLDALDALFARGQISPGCMILFDDWDCNNACDEHGERKAWIQLAQRYVVQFSDLGAYGCVGRRFIVHGYVSAVSLQDRQGEGARAVAS